jgi:type IV pilus assembly protein PilV
MARGFTLVEVLVALVVLAVGLLGAAAMLLESLQGSRIALERSRAVVLAGDMAERLRANRAAGNAYDTTDGTPDPQLDPACEQAGAGCNAATMAAHDLRRWQDAVAAALPQGVGTVDVAPLSPTANRCTIRLAWAQSGGAAPTTFTLVADL